MDRILKGIMRYRGSTMKQMVEEFRQVKDNPQVGDNFVFRCKRVIIMSTLIIAKSRLLHMHGQSDDTDTLHGHTCR